MQNNIDDSPLYAFDSTFADKDVKRDLVKDYEVRWLKGMTGVV